MAIQQPPNVWFQTGAKTWAIYEKTGPRTQQMWYIVGVSRAGPYRAYRSAQQTELIGDTIDDIKRMVVAELDRRRRLEDGPGRVTYPGLTPAGHRTAQQTMRNKKIKITLPSMPWDAESKK